MEFGVVSGAAIMGMVCTLIISVGLPIGLLIFAKIKYKASIATFFIGAGTFILFAMLLEQCLHTGVIALLGGADKLTANIWLYALYGGTAAAVFEETGRWIAIKFFLKNKQDRANAFMYGIGHGGIEAIIIVGLTSISNIASAFAINSGIIQTSLGLLDDATKATVYAQLSQLWTLPALQFYLGGIERVSAIISHIVMTFFIYKGVKSGKKKYIALAYVYHFVLDCGTVLLANVAGVVVVEVILLAFSALGAFYAYNINKDEQELS